MNLSLQPNLWIILHRFYSWHFYCSCFAVNSMSTTPQSSQKQHWLTNSKSCSRCWVWQCSGILARIFPLMQKQGDASVVVYLKRKAKLSNYSLFHYLSLLNEKKCKCLLLESAFGIVSVGSSLTYIDYKQKPMCWITSPVSLFTDDCSLNVGICIDPICY